MEDLLTPEAQRNKMINSMPAGIKSCVEDGGWMIVGHRNTSRWRVITVQQKKIVYIYLNSLLEMGSVQCKQLQNCMRLLQRG